MSCLKFVSRRISPKGRIIVRDELVTRGKVKLGTIAVERKMSALCDQSDARLTTTHTETRCLLEVVLHEALISNLIEP